MAPLADPSAGDPRWPSAVGPQPAPHLMQRTPPRLPPGFRWIAVRPGAPPPPRTWRRFRGPTPRYAVMPRWGLADRLPSTAPSPAAIPEKSGPAAPTVRAALFATIVVLGIAALVYAVRYVLLIVNRSLLLNSLVAGAALWLGVLASIAALVATIGCFVVLIRWLIARRAAAFAHHGLPEHRSARQLWAGCLLPLANVLWAPVYVIELAVVEDHYHRLRRPIVVWWITWGGQQCGVDLRHRHQLCRRRPGHRQQHGDDGRWLRVGRGRRGRCRAGVRRVGAQTGRTAGAPVARGAPGWPAPATRPGCCRGS